MNWLHGSTNQKGEPVRERSKLDDIRGTPMDVGSLEEFIDESFSQTSVRNG